MTKPYYIAPEVLNKKYNEKCDIWSLGVILYILLSGTPPFNGANDRQIMQAAQDGAFVMDSPEFKKVSSSAKDLVKKMLTKDFTKRISGNEVLAHPWFRNSLEDTNSGMSVKFANFVVGLG